MIYLEVELSAGVGLEQDLAIHLAKARLHCTLSCQPAEQRHTWRIPQVNLLDVDAV